MTDKIQSFKLNAQSIKLDASEKRDLLRGILQDDSASLEVESSKPWLKLPETITQSLNWFKLN
ncbi:MAG: hypothetical protein KBC48_00400 [Candidatus Pacebacteria bacterium]|nr:hypothetical protein [Candidatus Paceibacterota bacterium]